MQKNQFSICFNLFQFIPNLPTYAIQKYLYLQKFSFYLFLSRFICVLDLKQKKEVTLYYCEDYYNYFYGVLPISTGFAEAYEIKKYSDDAWLKI